MNELITTFTGNLNGESQSLVNARDLHKILGVGKDFSNWIKSRIEQYEFVDGEDYSPNLASGNNQGLSRFMPGHNRKDYALSLDMAKELCLVENTSQGKKARRYFIEVEKLARREIPAFLRKPLPALENVAIEKLQAIALHAKPVWRKITHYYKMGLTQNEIAKLVELDGKYLRMQLVQLNALGFIQYQKNPLRVQAGAKGLAIAKRLHWARQDEASGDLEGARLNREAAAALKGGENVH